jgi:glycosyltransferase involved in cell wall biosynthesis
VLFMIDHAGTPGGAERFVVGLAEHMPRDRVEPWVCSTRQGDETAIRALAQAGIPHLNLGRTGRWQVHRLGGLLRTVRRARFDVVHAHKFGSNVWGVVLGRLSRVPVILAHEHTWSYTGNRLRVWVDRWIIGRLATRFIAVSEADRRRMVEIEHVAREKTLVMPTAYIPHSRRDGGASGGIRAELGLTADVPLVGAAVGLRPQKALDVMLRAHARLIQTVHSAHLVIAGEGECLPELERLVEQLGIGDSVHLVGVRNDVDAILEAVDVGAMSSDWEGLPLFVFECMAARTPLVATAVGGLTEIVEDGITGLLVAPRDPDALADALARVLTDRPFAQRLASAAAERLHEYEIPAVAERFANLYEELTIESRGDGSASRSRPVSPS